MKIVILLLLLLPISSVFSQKVQETLLDRADFELEVIKSSTTNSEISPFFVDDNLYFSSIKDEFADKDRLQRLNKAFYDVYSLLLDNNGEEITSKRLVAGFGKKLHEGPVSWCKKTNELFVTVSNIEQQDTLNSFFPTTEIHLKIIVMEEVNGVWQLKEDLPFNNAKYNFAHPAISITGDTLVFASDMITDESHGKTDLYMSTRNKGKWSEVKNLGKNINTAGNELFPNFNIDGTLIFASDSLKGYGKLDLFYTELSSDRPAQNLGNIINSRQDDFGLVIHSSGNFGFLTSNRPGKGKDDIYKVKLYYKNSIVQGKVLSELNNDPLPHATVDIYDCANNKINRSWQTDSSGNFKFDVNTSCVALNVTKDGYYSDSTVVNDFSDLIIIKLNPMPLTAESKIQNEFKNDNISLLNKISNEDLESNKDSVPFESIYYAFDKWNLSEESKIKLDNVIEILNDQPDLKIECISHADSRGDSIYNIMLSKKRTESVVNYLVSKGINNNQITGRWVGENFPVNQCKDGIICSEAEYAVNRRTDISKTDDTTNRIELTESKSKNMKNNNKKINYFISKDSQGKYYIQYGAFSKLQDAEKYKNWLSNLVKGELKIEYLNNLYKVRIIDLDNLDHVMALIE